MFFYLLIVLTIFYLLAIMPKMLSHADISPFEGRFYAHRGFYDNNAKTPENSISAFKLAIENQYGIELDVRLTKDNVPVVFHDATLKRVCGLDKKVSNLTFEELSNLYLFDSNEKIPLLTDVLELINGEVPLIVELKATKNDTTICKIVAPILDNYTGIYCIESFNPMLLVWYKNNRPNVIRGQLSTNYTKDGIKNDKLLNLLLQNLLFNFVSKPDFIAYNYKYSNMLSYVLCHKLYKIPTFAYTIGSKEELQKNQDSFDLFIFEGFKP